MKERMTADGT